MKLLTPITLLLVLSLSGGEKAHWKNWAETPPMGWNSYDAYHGAITEAQFKGAVDVLAEKLLPHGWEYAVIDFCWFNPGPEGWNPDHDWSTFFVKQEMDTASGALTPELAMDEYGRLLPAVNRFPSSAEGMGFKAIGDYVHSKGMKFGIHIMRGIPRQAVLENTPILGTPYRARDIAEPWDYCRWNNNMYGIDHTKPGAQEYYNSLFNLYASWGVDYIKADDMTVPVYHKGEIEMMRKAIDQCGRPMILSLSCGETPIPEANHLKANANMWRVSIDFWDEWVDLRHMFDLLNSWAPHIEPGTWPDADMIPFGKLCLSNYPNYNYPGAKKAEHDSRFTWDEHQTLMSLWAMARSPLMWGGDPAQSSEKSYSYLTNDEVLEILKVSRNNRQLYHKFEGE
ncbi:MAG: glycoside hydrolase family 27 protein, partial [Opitutales bacterium]|nr:glycoside hydrolase family 27 protein [Opitutales bacterium]